jgi:4-hydroxy-L-threonine phosphate dehydrogenase PdxA
MSNQDKITVGISIGDLNGIGSEIVLKTFQDSRMLEFCTPVIFASVKVMSFFKKHYSIELNLHGIDTLDKIIPKKNKCSQPMERARRDLFWKTRQHYWPVCCKVIRGCSISA